MHPTLKSIQNPKVKKLLALKKARERKKLNLFTVEGIKEIELALEARYIFVSIFFCPDIMAKEILSTMGIADTLLIPVTSSVYQKIAYRNTTGGAVAVVQIRRNDLTDLSLTPHPLLLILESIEKPGNLGALLRTADAAGVDAVIVCDPHTDFYHPNVVRSSIGCLFTNQIASTTSEQALQWLKEKKISICCAHPQGDIHYDKVDYNRPCAIVMGTESTGLSEIWIKGSNNQISVPMHGKIDSMNVSVTAAIIVFEALQQRKNNTAK